MDSIVAFCIDEPLFLSNRILNKEVAKKYPGAYWISLLNEKLTNDGIVFVTGDIAISRVEAGEWRAAEINIIQHDISYYADKLLSLGAKPLILCCYESPLYAFSFYNSIHELALIYPNRVLFKGAFSLFEDFSENNHYIRFPNHDINAVSDLVDWNERKEVVVVSSNKYEGEISKIEKILKFILCKPNPKRLLNFLKNSLKNRNKKNAPVSSVLDKQLKMDGIGSLHNKRLELMEFFLEKSILDVYGKGWNSLDNLPVQWKKKLSPYITSNGDYFCDSKIDTISSYRFCLCIENYSYPGYVTEKIIDCFIAGVIPIYYGAPDIDDLIPSNTFINLKDFDSLESLFVHLNSINEQLGMDIIRKGRDFICSSEGKKFTYKYTSKLYYDMIISSMEQ